MSGLKRRGFLRLLGLGAMAPALPGRITASAAAGYNRYTYGLAVFHARTRASVSAADLVARLKVSAFQAEAMIGEMAASGIVRPVAASSVGAVRAVSAHPRTAPRTLDRIARRAADWLRAETDDITDAPLPDDRAPDTDVIPTSDRHDTAAPFGAQET